MAKQPQENTDFQQSDSVEDNVTLYNQPVDDAFQSDLQLTAALKEGKSIFQIKDLLKPTGKHAAAIAPPSSSSKTDGRGQSREKSHPVKQIRLSACSIAPPSAQHTLERVHLHSK
jgi:hypothetical protein